MEIFERIAKDSGGPIGQYRDRAHGYFVFPRLEGELGPHMRFNGVDVLNKNSLTSKEKKQPMNLTLAIKASSLQSTL